LGVTRTPSKPIGGIVIDTAAPPGGTGIAGEAGDKGRGIGSGTTLTGAGAQAAAAPTRMTAARFLTPQRII